MRRSSSPRLATFDYTGLYHYSLTICTADRRQEFLYPPIVSEVLEGIARAADLERFAVLAFCFMPDHLHLLVAGTALDSDGRRFIAQMKRLTGYRHLQTHGRRLWQRSAWDHVLRNDEDVWTTLRYILANPVRANLVRHPLDYPFLGSLTYPREVLIDAFRDTEKYPPTGLGPPD